MTKAIKSGRFVRPFKKCLSPFATPKKMFYYGGVLYVAILCGCKSLPTDTSANTDTKQMSPSFHRWEKRCVETGLTLVLQTEKIDYKENETVEVEVSIRNDSATAQIIDHSAFWLALHFIVYSRSGHRIYGIPMPMHVFPVKDKDEILLSSGEFIGRKFKKNVYRDNFYFTARYSTDPKNLLFLETTPMRKIVKITPEEAECIKREAESR